MEAQVQAMSLGEALVQQQPSNVVVYSMWYLDCDVRWTYQCHCVTLLLIEIHFRQDLIWSSVTAALRKQPLAEDLGLGAG